MDERCLLSMYGRADPKKNPRTRSKVRLDQGAIGLEVLGKMGPCVRKAKKINVVRDEGMEVGLKFDIGKTVGIVKCNAKLIQGRGNAIGKGLVKRNQGVSRQRVPIGRGIHSKDGGARDRSEGRGDQGLQSGSVMHLRCTGGSVEGQGGRGAWSSDRREGRRPLSQGGYSFRSGRDSGPMWLASTRGE